MEAETPFPKVCSQEHQPCAMSPTASQGCASQVSVGNANFILRDSKTREHIKALSLLGETLIRGV